MPRVIGVTGNIPVAFDPIRNIVFINEEEFQPLSEDKRRAIISHADQMPFVKPTIR